MDTGFQCDHCKVVCNHHVMVVAQIRDYVFFTSKCAGCMFPVESLYKTTIENWKTNFNINLCEKIM